MRKQRMIQEITDKVVSQLKATDGDVDWRKVNAFLSSEVGKAANRIVRAANQQFDIEISSNDYYRHLMRASATAINEYEKQHR